MPSALLLVDPVKGKSGVYTVPETLSLAPDEPMDYLEEFPNAKKEKAVLQANGHEYPMDVYVHTVNGMRFPFVLFSDLEGIE